VIHPLRQWLGEVDKLGELVRIDQPVDPVEEMSAVTYLVAKQTPSPAVVSDNPEGPNDAHAHGGGGFEPGGRKGSTP
jgi:4-hydroxy-3-polyprenylbenzoate decarboxylase